MRIPVLIRSSLSLASLLSSQVQVVAGHVAPRETATTSSTSYPPLITGFTPPPECSSLTIMHFRRATAHVLQGCLGSDHSCCPQSGRVSNTYSPGRCPPGYTTQDPHVGLDSLGIDTIEWEATCVPSGFSTCTAGRLPGGGQIPLMPGQCPWPYHSDLPSLTTPLTAIHIYYKDDIDNALPWPYRVGHRTTTVISDVWPTLTPASTPPTFVQASHFVIRWKESDFDTTKPAPGGSSSTLVPSETVSSQSSLSNPITSSSSSRTSALPDEESSTTRNASPSKSTIAGPPSNPQGLSQRSLAAIIVCVILGIAGLVFGVLFLRYRKRKGGANREIELVDPGPNIGLLTLYKCDEEPIVDIVFIHGLRGHRTRTWTKDGCCWPRDLLPRVLPGIRVLTFGYDSSVARVVGKSSRNNISQHAMSLLSDLLDMRTDDPERPIIFVTHSLGGILVKDALHKSRQPTQAPRYTPLFTSTHSILFLGTPHHGSTYARVGRSLASKLRYIFRDTNSNLLRSLEYDSEILERISEDFRNTLAESEGRGRKIRIASFAEELSMRGLASPIVHTRSAFIGLPDEITETIWAHHRDLCRFGDEFDPGYNRISRRIVEFVADASAGNETERSRVSLEDVGLVEEVDEEDLGVASREDVQL